MTTGSTHQPLVEAEVSTRLVAIDMFSGTFAGAVNVLFGHPFDSLKVRAQLKNKQQVELGTRYSQQQGIALRGLYRGVLPTLLTSGLINSASFGIYEWVKRVLSRDGIEENANNVLFAGLTSGAAMSVVQTPVNRVKVQLQTTTSTQFANGPRGVYDCVRTLVAKEGVYGGLYRSIGPNFFTSTFGRGLYLYFYHVFKKVGTGQAEMHGGEFVSVGLLAGTGARALSSFLIYPFDVIKTRLSAQTAGKPVVYTGMMDCARQSVKSDGWRVFFRGVGIVLVRGLPGGAVMLPAYDFCHGLLCSLLLRAV